MATVIPSIACLGVIGRNNNPLHLTILPSYDPTSSCSATTSTPSTTAKTAPLRTPLQFSLLLSSTLDVFELRARAHAASGAGALSGDLGLLCAVDERLACYGYETNTGVRFVAVVDMRGRLLDPSLPPASDPSSSAAAGGEGDNNNNIIPSSIPPLLGIGQLPGGGGGGGFAATTASARKTSLAASVASAAAGLREAELKPLFRGMQTAWVRLLQNPFFELDEHVSPSGRGGRKITSRKFGEDLRRLGSAWMPGVGGFEGF